MELQPMTTAAKHPPKEQHSEKASATEDQRDLDDAKKAKRGQAQK